MLRVLRVDTSNAYISVSTFARQGPFSQARSYIGISMIIYLFLYFQIILWLINKVVVNNHFDWHNYESESKYLMQLRFLTRELDNTNGLDIL